MIERYVPYLALLIEESGMTVREGAARHILAGEADAIALVQQRAEGQRFGHRPVDLLAGLDHFTPSAEHTLQARVEVEFQGYGGDGVADTAQHIAFHRSLARAMFGGRRLHAAPLAFEPVGLVRLVAFGGVKLVLKAGLKGLGQLRRFIR